MAGGQLPGVRAQALVLVISLGAAGCGSAGGSSGTGRLPADVAAGLATRAEQVAAALDAGACDDALARARSLQTDIAALPVDPAVRAEALAGAARLTSGINCPVTSTTAPPAPAVPLPDNGKKGKGHKGDHDDG
jgi:hypothetical protein